MSNLSRAYAWGKDVAGWRCVGCQPHSGGRFYHHGKALRTFARFCVHRSVRHRRFRFPALSEWSPVIWTWTVSPVTDRDGRTNW